MATGRALPASLFAEEQQRAGDSHRKHGICTHAQKGRCLASVPMGLGMVRVVLETFKPRTNAHVSRRALGAIEVTFDVADDEECTPYLRFEADGCRAACQPVFLSGRCKVYASRAHEGKLSVRVESSESGSHAIGHQIMISDMNSGRILELVDALRTQAKGSVDCSVAVIGGMRGLPSEKADPRRNQKASLSSVTNSPAQNAAGGQTKHSILGACAAARDSGRSKRTRAHRSARSAPGAKPRFGLGAAARTAAVGSIRAAGATSSKKGLQNGKAPRETCKKITVLRQITLNEQHRLKHGLSRTRVCVKDSPLKRIEQQDRRNAARPIMKNAMKTASPAGTHKITAASSPMTTTPIRKRACFRTSSNSAAKTRTSATEAHAARTQATEATEHETVSRTAGDDSGAATPTVLSEQQAAAIRSVVEHKRSVFVTGGAGTGKSTALREIVRRLKHVSKHVHVTATTGFAAAMLQLGATTLHQFAGITPSMLHEEPSSVVARLLRRLDVVQRWRTCRVLIIDEVSMLEARLFSLLEHIARELRGNRAPFGGVQLVCVGDFLQLPPVCQPGAGGELFCFESDAWGKCIQEVVELKAVFRQLHDPAFAELLERQRWGACTAADFAALQARVKRGGDSGNTSASSRASVEHTLTKLCTHTRAAESINADNLRALPGPDHVFAADDRGNAMHCKKLDKACNFAAKLRLRVGAPVLLLKTVSMAEGLCNGSHGVVIRFTRTLGLPVVRFASLKTNAGASHIDHIVSRDVFRLTHNDVEVASRSQLPLALGWAVSIHRSQGVSLDKAEIDLGKAFEYGQAYVAMSRVRSLDGLVLRPFDRGAKGFRAHPRVVEFYRALRRQSSRGKTGEPPPRQQRQQQQRQREEEPPCPPTSSR